MGYMANDLSDEFPNLADRITVLRQTDSHFARLADAYHEVNEAVTRAETTSEPMDYLSLARMRRDKMALKDAIANHLKD